MGTNDVLKVPKTARAIHVGECNRFNTSGVTINHEMYQQVHTMFLKIILNKITPSLRFHRNFRVALHNLYRTLMHSSLTKRKRCILRICNHTGYGLSAQKNMESGSALKRYCTTVPSGLAITYLGYKLIFKLQTMNNVILDGRNMVTFSQPIWFHKK